jgi:arylsulfatase A-like enzyme
VKPCLVLIGLLIGVQPAVASDPPPNIVVFLVDDLGWQDVSVPLGPQTTPFNERYATPNVERLARRGMRFTDAYASAPVCSPTRTSLLTGRSPAATGITWWLAAKDTHTSKRHASLDPPAWTVNGLQPGDVTLPGLLALGGYHTIHVGKAHLGARGTAGGDPLRLGFAANVAGTAHGSPGSYYGKHDFGVEKRTGRKGYQVPGLEAYHGENVFLTDALGMEAAREVRLAAAKEGPFFLHFASYAVHTPIMANERLLSSYEELDPREAAYATMVESADAALGAVLDTLAELGLTENTLVVFTSDNGGLSAHSRGGQAHTHNAPLRSGKGSAYEGGVRVPLVVVWPGVTAPGSLSHEPVISHDLFPTLLAAAGVEIPEAHGQLVEGRDLTPLLKGETPKWSGRSLYWHQPHLWGANGPGIWPFSSVRHGRWKLIFDHARGAFELYDLERDLSEARDLSGEKPERVGALAEELSLWLESTEARMSVVRETGQAVKMPREYLGQGGR